MNKKNWSDVQKNASIPGSRILTEFKQQCIREREFRNSVSPDPTASTDQISLNSREAVEFFSSAGAAASGEVVTPQSAMRVSAVYRCVWIISCGIAALPLHMYKNTEGGNKERLHGEKISDLLNSMPTAMYAAPEHWEQAGQNVMLRGDSFTYIKRSRSGEPLELVPLPWSAVSVQRDTTTWPGRLKYYISDVRTFGCDQDDMLHFSNMGFDGVRSPSTLQFGAYNAVGNAQAMDNYSGKFFSGGAHPSIVLETEKSVGPELIKKTSDTFVEKYSGRNNINQKPLILTEGLKVSRLSLSAEDAQLLEARKFQVADIGRAFGVPLFMLNEMTGSTSWGTGLEQLNKALVTWTLNPYLRRIEREVTRKLAGSGVFFEFNRNALMEGDSKTQSEFWRKALGGPGNGPGWMTVNEVRKVQNLPPVNEPWADQVFYDTGKNAATNSKKQEEPNEEDEKTT